MKRLVITFFAIIAAASFVMGQTNSGLPSGPPSSSTYTPPVLNPVGCGDVLLYTDDPYNEPDFIDIALQNLGYTYTGYYNDDFAGFETALTSGSWDIVIFANDNNGPPPSTYNALLLYVQAGGKLIYHSWQQDIPLEAALGVSVVSSYGTPIPVYRWNPVFPLFTTPNGVPDLTDLNSFTYGTDGWYTDPIPSAIGFAGYTGAPSAGQCGLVVGNNGKTIYQGWMDANIDNADSDGKNDQVELYENMLAFLCPPPQAPVDNWALILGITLIALFMTYRFIRR